MPSPDLWVNVADFGLMQARVRAVAQAKGENPLFAAANGSGAVAKSLR